MTKTKNHKNKIILVSGSLAYDRIMDFPGSFKDHILPDKIHILNVSFLINDVKENFGGTAGNIAYSLALLGEKPTILGVAGEDFGKYEKWLKANHIDTRYIKKCPGHTASAYITTDQNDNQITAFYGGAADVNYCQIVHKFAKVDLAIVSPDNLGRMKKYCEFYKKKNIPYIFDPGQQITSFKSADLKMAINGCKILIGNDYEIQLILNILKIDMEKLRRMVKTIIITKGAKGCEINNEGKVSNVNPAKPKNSSDPTGAGDAFRSGLIKGLVNGWSIGKACRLGSVVAVYTVEKYGTQTHKFTWKELAKRYMENYKEVL
jgi:adenosine kinase